MGLAQTGNTHWMSSYTHRVSTPFDSTEPLSAHRDDWGIFSHPPSPRSNSRRQRPPWGTKRVVGTAAFVAR